MRRIEVSIGLAIKSRIRAFLLRLRPVVFLSAALAMIVSCTPKETKTLLQPSEALGTVLAEETARMAGTNTKIAIISHDDKWGPASTTEEAFKAALKQRGFSTFIAKSAYLGNPMHSGQIGLQAADFFEALEKAKGAGAIVSLAGAPLLPPNGAAQIQAAHPPILIVATGSLGDQPGVPGDPTQINNLLKAKVIQIAIVNRGTNSAAPSPGKTDAIHESFAEDYAILRQPQ